MNDSDYFQRASAAALRYLSHRPRSEAEVRTRLRRQFPPYIIERVIEDLKDQSLLDDSDFARLWTRSRDSHRPRSLSAIRRELLAKGVDQDLARQAVRFLDDDDSAYRAGAKLARQMQATDFSTFRRRLWGYLKRRGYGDSVSRKTIFRLWKDYRHESEQAPDEMEDL